MTAVSMDGMKGAWHPRTCMQDGLEFFHLDRWDRKMCTFLTGKALEMRGNKTMNIVKQAFFHELRTSRRHACNLALQETVRASAPAAGEDPPQKVRNARDEDKYIVSHVVTMRMPRVDFQGESMGPLDMKVLWGCRKADVFIELSRENLIYLRLKHAVSPENDVKKRRMPLRKKKNRGASPKKRLQREAQASVEAVSAEETDSEADAVEAAAAAHGSSESES